MTYKKHLDLYLMQRCVGMVNISSEMFNHLWTKPFETIRRIMTAMFCRISPNDERLPPPEEKAVHYIHNIEQAQHSLSGDKCVAASWCQYSTVLHVPHIYLVLVLTPAVDCIAWLSVCLYYCCCW